MVEQRSKKHHYLPRFILEGFAERGRVATFDLRARRAYAQSVDTAAAENDYNTVELEDGSKSDIAERAIASDVEGPASAVLQRIAAGGWIESPEERLAVGTFLALQYLRVPMQRAFMDQMADMTMKLDMAAQGPSGMRRVLVSQLGREPTAEEVQDHWDAVKDFDDWQIHLTTNRHVVDLLEHAAEFGPALVDIYGWHPIRWQRKHLLTSDQPVVLVPPPNWPAWQGVGLYTAGAIYFPLSRSTGLLLDHRANDHDWPDGFPVPPTAAAARGYNRAVSMSAQTRVYHHPGDELADLVGVDFDLPAGHDPALETEHSRTLRDRLAEMGQWAFDNPDQPHPMAGLPDLPTPPPGARPFKGSWEE